MIVWGGSGDSGDLNTGGRYDPEKDSWAATSTTNAPAGRDSHTAIWSGIEMIVWGGATSSNWFNSGGRYCVQSGPTPTPTATATATATPSSTPRVSYTQASPKSEGSTYAASSHNACAASAFAASCHRATALMHSLPGVQIRPPCCAQRTNTQHSPPMCIDTQSPSSVDRRLYPILLCRKNPLLTPPWSVLER